MSVRADQRAVKTYVTCLCSRHDGEVSGQEISFHNAVLFVKQVENIHLDLVGFLALKRSGAQQDVEILCGNSRAQGLSVLALTQVRQQIVDVEHGIGLVFTDGDLDDLAVLLDDHTVQSKRGSNPLVLAHAAVVAGLEEAKAAVLIQRGLL